MVPWRGSWVVMHGKAFLNAHAYALIVIEFIQDVKRYGGYIGVGSQICFGNFLVKRNSCGF